jgi:hypothetical protein
MTKFKFPTAIVRDLGDSRYLYESCQFKLPKYPQKVTEIPPKVTEIYPSGFLQKVVIYSHTKFYRPWLRFEKVIAKKPEYFW